MKSRRSVRLFRSDCPPREQIERLIEAAITAPSASNKQPWRFIVVTNREKISELASFVRAAVDRIAHHVEPASQEAFRSYGDYFTRFDQAPVVIVALFRSLTVLSNLVDAAIDPADRERIRVMEENSGLIGVSMAIENLLLSAHEMGLGASGMTGPLVAVDHLKKALEVSPSWDIAALIPVGYPAEQPLAPDRKPAQRVMTWVE
ncbi:MAG TPA: nitroreductase family protein [Planctomycetota bacterium]|nr:nitroreductase family protein [Planctomycetota bacterium]